MTTVPEYLEIRFDHQTQVITNIIFLFAYAVILLPIILYTGATGLIGILDVQGILGLDSHTQTLWLIVIAVGLTGSVYALFGGLRTVAVSDLLNGIGLLISGFMIAWFGINALGDGDCGQGMQVLTRGLLKLLGPIYLVIPGMIAFAMFAGQDVMPDHSYGKLVNSVLPTAYAGFFAAVMMGAILSRFNSALNSTCTLFSLGLYKSVFRPDASQTQVMRVSKVFGWTITLVAMFIAPMLAGQVGIFSYLQKMNGIYAIPIFAVVLTGMLTRNVPAKAAKIALVAGFLIVACGYFLPPLAVIVNSMHEFHFQGIVFAYLVIIMLVIGEIRPRIESWVQKDVGALDLTPWRHSRLAGLVLIGLVLAIYIAFADLSVLQ